MPASDVATVARQADGQISLTLVDGAGRPIGERVFPRARTCRDDAQSVAVALAIWEARPAQLQRLRLEQHFVVGHAHRLGRRHRRRHHHPRAPTTAQYIRITQTSNTPSRWWSITKLDLYVAKTP